MYFDFESYDDHILFLLQNKHGHAVEVEMMGIGKSSVPILINSCNTVNLPIIKPFLLLNKSFLIKCCII